MRHLYRIGKRILFLWKGTKKREASVSLQPLKSNVDFYVPLEKNSHTLVLARGRNGKTDLRLRENQMKSESKEIH